LPVVRERVILVLDFERDGHRMRGITKTPERQDGPDATLDHADLEARLARLDPLIAKAAAALLTFSPPGFDAFVRESSDEDLEAQDPSVVVSVTSTARAVFALFEYLRIRVEEQDRAPEGVSEKLARVAETILSDPQAMDRSRNERNMFTASQFLLAASLILKITSLTGQPVAKVDVALLEARKVATENARQMVDWGGGRIDVNDATHHFITLHLVRGIDAIHQATWSAWEFPPALAASIRDDVIRELGYRAGGLDHRFDPAELIFSLAVLNRTGLFEVPRLTREALEMVADQQTPDGAWPTARVISYRAGKLLHVPSHEVALALTDLLIRDLAGGGRSLTPIVMPMLDRSLDLVESTYHETPQDNPTFKGWANDRAQSEDVVESWVTAVVLTFLVHLREALLLRAQNEILSKYQRRISPAAPTLHEWPDLAPALRPHPGELGKPRWPIVDPEAGALAARVDEVYLRPVVKSPLRKPNKASLILYGPPGTRKTSLAKAISQSLRWPMLTLTPPDFLRRGLEGIDEQADEIFQDLMRLRRVVVLFDECEDFFKVRPKDARVESRTIGAFITAGMLPRLQELRDRRWLIFVLATNVELDKLDEAVTRPGRFDYAERLDHPVLKAQVSYLADKEDHGDLLAESLKQWARGWRRRGTRIPFTTLDELARRLADNEMDATKEAIMLELDELTSALGPPSLTR
jgi:hypothetical protein